MKTAIIGLGVIGKVHAQVLKEQQVNVVALCDIKEERSQMIGERYFPDAQIYGNYVDMLDKEQIDIVHICTPHWLHAEMVIACLQRDINVFCEKPLCINEKEIEAIIQAEKLSNAQLGVCLQNRYNPANQYVKKYLKTEEILNGYGTVLWNRDKEYYASGTWRGKWATEGGGVMINQALHTLDLLQWFFDGSNFVVASTENFTLKDCIEVEDSAMAIFEKENKKFTFFATNGCGADYPVEMTLQTKKGWIKVFPDKVLHGDEIVCFDKKNKILSKGCYGTGHETIIADFYRCIQEKKAFWINGKEASKVIKMILAMYKSQGKQVKI